jgi:hypothetical protein
MKKTVIIAAAAIAGAAAFSYLFGKRRKDLKIPAEVKNGNSHHLTNIFANAKKHINDIKN